MADPLAATNLVDWAAAERDMVPHIETLKWYASRKKTILELGVRGGVSTWALLDGLPGVGKLVSVDVDNCIVPRRVSEDPRWTFIVGDDMDPAIQAQLPEEVDLAFVDTSHEYEHTLAELRFVLTRDPSVILCHDAEWPGVIRAISEFCVQNDWTIATFDIAGDASGGFSLATLMPK